MFSRLFRRQRYGRKGSIRMVGAKNKIAIGAMLALFVAAIVGGAIFVPRLLGKNQSPAPSNLVDSSLSAVSSEVEDLSQLQNEALIKHSTITDPLLVGNEIVYSTRVDTEQSDHVFIYHNKEKTATPIKILKKYNNVIWLRMNEDYIVYLDAAIDGGGRICAYDRTEEVAYVVKEYAYGLPQIALSGELLAFSQQAGENTDRLYIYNLCTRESVTVQVLENTPAVSGSVSLNQGVLTYAVAYYESNILRSRVVCHNVTTGERLVYEWGRYVYSPSRSGKYIAFSSSTTGLMDDIFLSEDGQNPTLLVEDVSNFATGDGFLAYTKADAVFIYVFSTGKTYQLNTKVSKGLLASVSGKHVCWYDVTSSKDVDIVKYATVDVAAL